MANQYQSLVTGQIRTLAANLVAASPGTTATVAAQITELDSISTINNSAAYPSHSDLMSTLSFNGPLSKSTIRLLQSILDLPANQP